MRYTALVDGIGAAAVDGRVPREGLEPDFLRARVLRRRRRSNIQAPLQEHRAQGSRVGAVGALLLRRRRRRLVALGGGEGEEYEEEEGGGRRGSHVRGAGVDLVRGGSIGVAWGFGI